MSFTLQAFCGHFLSFRAFCSPTRRFRMANPGKTGQKRLHEETYVEMVSSMTLKILRQKKSMNKCGAHSVVAFCTFVVVLKI